MIIKKLEALEKQSIQRGIPILGSEKGSWLYKKVLEAKPKKILELGTANGYSGCILGSQGAKLLTIDIDSQITDEAKKNFEKFGIDAEIIVGDGVEEVQRLVSQKFLGYFDIIFIDFAKKKYIQVLENCIKLVRKGGLIIADNTSFPKCKEYRKAVLNHPKLKTEIISIEDEMTCSEKI